MSRFASKELVRVDLGEDDWVQLRTLTFGDRQAIQRKLIQVNGGEFDASQVDLEAANVELLRRVIAAWGGPGFECSCAAKESPHAAGCGVRPISDENILGLDTTGDRLIDEVSKMQVRNADLKAQLSEGLSGGATSTPKKAKKPKAPRTP